MRHLLFLAGLATMVGCGETENFIGSVPEVAGAGGAPPLAGTSAGGSATAGTSSGGSTTLGGAGGKPAVETDCTVGDGNWISCEDGLVHRREPGTCPSTLPRETTLEPKSAEDDCVKDSDCTAAAHGYCSLVKPSFGDVAERNACFYGCTSDADCGETSVCSCADPVGRCVQASACKSDQDCPGASLCARYDSCPGVPIAFDYSCQLPADECRTNADCSGRERYCGIGVSGHRECVREQCAI